MKRTKRPLKKLETLHYSSSDEEPLGKKIKRSLASTSNNNYSSKRKNLSSEDGSSSESDLGDYLKTSDKIDLDSSFFDVAKPSFDNIERNIFAGVSRLSESDSDEETAEDKTLVIGSKCEQVDNNETIQSQGQTVAKLNFQQLQNYTNKIEEAKRQVERYQARKRIQEKRNKKKGEKDLDIGSLLAVGEKSNLPNSILKSDDSDSEQEDWEEVKLKESQELKENKSHLNIPKEGVEITVQLPGVLRKKKGVDLLTAMKRRLNRIRKENQVYVHKVHLLCWIAHGNFVNSIINKQNILSLALSLLPSQNSYPSDRPDLKYLEQLVKWYSKTMDLNEKKSARAKIKGKSLEDALEEEISSKKVYKKKHFVYIFIALLRSLAIDCRLVLSFQVEPLHPPPCDLHSLGTGPKTKSEEVKSKKESAKKTLKPTASVSTVKPPSKVVKPSTSKSTVKINNVTKGKEISRKKQVEKDQSNTSRTCSSKKAGIKKREKKLVPQVDGTFDSSDDEEIKCNSSIISIAQLDGSNDTDNDGPGPGTSNRIRSHSRAKPNLNKLKKTPQSKRLIATSQYISRDSEEEFVSTPRKNNNSPPTKKRKPKDTSTDSPQTADSFESRFSSIMEKSRQEHSKFFSKPSTSRDVKSDVVSLVKGRIKEQKEVEKRRRGKGAKTDEDEDSDYVPEAVKKKRHDSDDELVPKVKVKKRVRVKPEVEFKVPGSDSEPDCGRKRGVDVWVEVFLEAEEKWICVDVFGGEVHCIKEIYARATHPVSYIVAWNTNNSIKDISRRYCKNFNTVTRKLRIDSQWWEKSLKPFKGKQTVRDREEDEELARQQLEGPLPTSIAEYKNHPLYVLERHLLKFQAIYPPNCVPVGFVRNEAVYPRDCVYTLHSRDIWLKHAKVVRPKEEPYKTVKARPKYDKLSNQTVSGLELEVFGPWQVEEYVPPTAENGVVPRNAYGNVDLFKSCMLPKKTVHLRLPGLNKVAKKLNIDCAPAVTGFDFHSGWSHPTFDGFVVCEEFRDVLVAAWEEEQEIIVRKEREKIEKRVYDNWKKLIRGLLIRERLKAKYDFEGTGKKKTKTKTKMTPKKKRIVESDSE